MRYAQRDPDTEYGDIIIKDINVPPRLVDILAVDPTSFHAPRIERIDNEDYSFVIRKVAEEMLKQGIVADPRWLAEGVLALKQYYAVALLDGHNQHAVSDVIDPFWHAHILDTHAYVAFCNDVMGQYMHHVPLDKGDRDEVERIARLYRYTAHIYPQMFTYINEDFYPLEPSPEALDDLLICFHEQSHHKELTDQAMFPKVDMACYA